MIKWEEKFATGVEAIDRQHKFLFEMFNDFEDAIHEGRGESYLKHSFPLLEAYAQAHFHFEEGCMHQHKCPISQDNKNAHETFVVKLTAFKKQHESGPTEELCVQMHDFIEKWIVNHIIGMDTHLKSCIDK